MAQYFPPALLTTNCRQEWGLLVITVESLPYYWALLYICIVANKSTEKIKVFSASPLKIIEQMACALFLVIILLVRYQEQLPGLLKPGASTPDESRSGNLVMLFPYPCEPLSGRSRVFSWLTSGCRTRRCFQQIC